MNTNSFIQICLFLWGFMDALICGLIDLVANKIVLLFVAMLYLAKFYIVMQIGKCQNEIQLSRFVIIALCLSTIQIISLLLFSPFF